MIPPHLLYELIDLLSPLARTAPERFTLLMGAFGNDHPILNQLKWTDTTESFVTDMLNKLDEYGEFTPGNRAVWVLVKSLLEPGRVGVDRRERLLALEKVLNASTPVTRLSGMGLSVFISYARTDDELFAQRLRDDLVAHGFKVWWDRVSMPNRGLTFLQEIQQAIIEVDRVILVFGPGAMESHYVWAEWEFALSICKPMLTLLRLGDYNLLPKALRQRDVPDFRDDSQYLAKLDYLVSQLCESGAPLGKLVNVPSLPPQFQTRSKDLRAVKNKLLVDANKLVMVTTTSRRAGLQGLGGIGKTVLATAVARDCDVRRSFPDGVLWVTLGQSPNLTALQADLCRALGDSPQTFGHVQQGKARLSKLMQDKACLLVIDDLWKLDHARAFETTGPRGALLITTRDGRLVDKLDAAKHLVNVLTEDEALTLMARWLMPKDGTPLYDELEQMAQLERLKAAMPPEAKMVASECGYLPSVLALSAVQVRGGVAWTTLLDGFQATTLEALAAFSRKTSWLFEEIGIPSETGTILSYMHDIGTEVGSALQSDSPTNRVRRLREAMRIADQFRLAPGTFGTILARWSAILAAGLEAAQREQETSEPIPQAYIQDGCPIHPGDSDTFKGRSRQFAEMENALGGTTQHPTFLLYGQRRSGKTSMLLQLPKRLGSRVIPAFVDLQDAGNAENAASIIGRITEIVSSESLKRRRISLPEIHRQMLTTDPYVALGQWLDQIEQALGDRILLLNLDEFETLEKAIERGRLDERILAAIRSIMQFRQQVVVLLSGSHRIEELPPRWASALVTTKIIELSFLDREAASELITKPTRDFPSIYTPKAVDKIIELTHCQPYLIQVACGHLVERMNGARRIPPHSYVAVEDVEAIIPQVTTTASNYFSDQWHTETGSEVARRVLEKIAAASGAELSREVIRRVEQDEAALHKAIETLLNREIIERSPNGNGYCITLPLFAEYVRRKTLI